MAIVKLSDEEYFKIPAISNSLLSRFARCPAAASVPIEATPAMSLGTALHCCVLDGAAEFQKRFYVMDKADGRTKEGKAIKAQAEIEAQGRTIISMDDMMKVRDMAASVYNHPSANDFLRDGKPEMAITWKDKETGIDCKAKADWISPNVLIDLKTTQSADQWVFQRTIWNMGYAKQLGLYHDGLLANLFPVDKCVIIAVESSAPYCCNVFNISDDLLEAGKGQYRKLLREYKACADSGQFPAYQCGGVIDVQLPAFARED